MFAELAFSEDLNRGDAEDKRVQGPGKQIPVAGVFRIKCKSLTVLFLPASLRVSAVKLFIDLSKSAEHQRAKRPASNEDSSEQRSSKYQLTRNSQLSAFGLTFQICEMCKQGKAELLPARSSECDDIIDPVFDSRRGVEP